MFHNRLTVSEPPAPGQDWPKLTKHNNGAIYIYHDSEAIAPKIDTGLAQNRLVWRTHLQA